MNQAKTLTVLQRALMGTTLTPEQQSAVCACVSVQYDGCPSEIAEVLKPLLEAERGTRAERLHEAGIGGLEPDSVGRAMDEARERTGCPYLALKQGDSPDKFKVAMMIATRGGGGTIMRARGGDETEERLVQFLRGLTKEMCISELRSIGNREPLASPSRAAFLLAAYRVENGTAI